MSISITFLRDTVVNGLGVAAKGAIHKLEDVLAKELILMGRAILTAVDEKIEQQIEKIDAKLAAEPPPPEIPKKVNGSKK